MRTVKLFSGEYVDPFYPDIEKIHIGDIAHSLAHQCRFNGHCDVFYSVAQHSVLVSNEVKKFGPIVALYGLLHDAPEFVLGDIVSPVKREIPQIGELEKGVAQRIFTRFGLPYPILPQQVKDADRYMLALEARSLMSATDAELINEYGLTPPPSEVSLPAALLPWDAMGSFLRAFEDLSEQIEGLKNEAV